MTHNFHSSHTSHRSHSPRLPAGPPPPASAPAEDDFRFPPVGRLLKRLGIHTIHGRGQHFLRRPEMGDRIAALAEAGPDDVVVEIGAGLGNLTVPLARRAGRVHAVEPDRRFEPWHTHLAFFYKNLVFHQQDFLESPVDEWTRGCPGPIAVGNLPYNLTSPILFRLLEGPVRWKRIVVMVQREVAERMIAEPGGRLVGNLTHKVQYYTRPTIALAIPPGEFLPPPKVQSRIVVLEPRPDPLDGDVERRRRVFDLVEKSFQHRRKTLPNALGAGGWWPDERDAVEAAVRAAGIDPRARPETLALEDFFRLEAAFCATEE